MEILILCLAALLTSLLTFFSGFGLGTILTPVFAIFFPLEVAIALTGVVHFLNNIFKLVLVGNHGSKKVVIHFGVPAFFASLLGAYLLLQISDLQPVFRYTIDTREFFVTPQKLIIAVLLIFFALIEVIPILKNIQIGKGNLVVGGILSGFFGGLSGHQGALRSAFLIKSGMTKESFIATGIIIACIVDISRLGIYSTRFLHTGIIDSVPLVLAATLSAFAGAYLGSKLLTKVTFSTIQILVTVMLIGLSIGIGLGLI